MRKGFRFVDEKGEHSFSVIDGNSLVVGRRSPADVVIEKGYFRVKQAQVSCFDGECTVTDYWNRLSVNGERTYPGIPSIVQLGDLVQIVDINFQVCSLHCEEDLSWRNSQFFEQQFESITALGGVSEEEIGYILNESDDEPLLVLAKGLEKRGDGRGQYIRDICSLTRGKVRPLSHILERVIAFESRQTSRAWLIHRVDECTVVTVTKTLTRNDVLVMADSLHCSHPFDSNLTLVFVLNGVPFTPEMCDALIELDSFVRNRCGRFRVVVGRAGTASLLGGFVPKPFDMVADIEEAIDSVGLDHRRQMNARLTMNYGPQLKGDPSFAPAINAFRRAGTLVFKLTCATAVFGRRPVEVSHLPEVAAKIERCEAFSLEFEDTLFVGIPFDMRLTRNHFAISRSDASGQTTYWIEDLGSRCGTKLNDERLDGKVCLKSGDKILWSYQFDFDAD